MFENKNNAIIKSIILIVSTVFLFGFIILMKETLQLTKDEILISAFLFSVIFALSLLLFLFNKKIDLASFVFLALTLGGKTTKLKFGHRGCNHPVKDLEENKVHITSQNHGYVVETLPEDVVATHININDGTIEGMKHTKLPIFSVQFHPEAAAGPQDSEYIFDKFLNYAL